ncbi:ABC transporter substrate-binding protein [Novosphingobium terrae]|uniref:ABC transporter substrate-binding protein n=1 Tax=Novosphingobium terrae TaxID=2726189 RepID=UPI00197EC69A|nr:ABC transporter substrate-binding protein [Novosphingobium terrae]
MPADPISTPHVILNRRGVLVGAAGLGLLSLLEGCGGNKVAANTLIIGLETEPTSLTTAITSAGAVQFVSSKIFDGLLGYAHDLSPIPRLATAWETAADHLSITLHLRQGVKWHDGQPFTSADVAYSLLEVWKKYHSRGRATFANVVNVDTPDPQTAVLRLSRPSPAILHALASNESQVVPRHLYEGKDVLTNPANNAPVGTGPFKFVSWDRGQAVTLARNPDYWDAGKPHLDALVFRLITDASSQPPALETGEVQLCTGVAWGDVTRVSTFPGVAQDKLDHALQTSSLGLEFNLDLPKLRDVRLRQAIAHAIDNDFVKRNILFGRGEIATGPIPSNITQFYSKDVPLYPFDRHKAEALLDEAGLHRGPDGTRLSFILDPLPTTDLPTKMAQYMRAALEPIGIRVQLRSQDFAAFVKRAYTDRDFEVLLVGGQMGPDPAIGMQRFYWSKSFKKGVAFSNASHYASPEADRLLEAAQSEPDQAKRRALYADFQRLVQTDLPRIPLISYSTPVLTRTRLSPLPDTAEGIYGNFADLKLAPA